MVIFRSSTAPIWSNKSFSFQGDKRLKLNFPDLHLVSGSYKIGVDINIPKVTVLVSIEDALLVTVENDRFYNGTKKMISGRDGYVMVDHTWEF